MRDELQKVEKIIDKVNKGKKKMSGQQYMDMMVCLKGIQANLQRPSKPKPKRSKMKNPEVDDFKPGDKVKLKNGDGMVKNNAEGMVCNIITHIDDKFIGIEWDNFTDGHQCDGHCADGRGRYHYYRELEIIG